MLTTNKYCTAFLIDTNIFNDDGDDSGKEPKGCKKSVQQAPPAKLKEEKKYTKETTTVKKDYIAKYCSTALKYKNNNKNNEKQKKVNKFKKLIS